MSEQTDIFDEFLDGFLCFAQEVLGYGREEMIQEILRESGYSKEEFLESQRKSGFRSNEMIPLIKKAFED